MAITRYPGINYGSLIRIEYLRKQDIVSFRTTTAGMISAGEIVLTDGASWTAIYCSEDTMGHRQLETRDAAGEYFEQSVVGFIPGETVDIDTGLLQLSKTRYLLRITRPDGLVKIVGTLSQPLELIRDSNTQTTVPGAAGTALTFSGITSKRALIYVT
ncbi:MAG TPA: hypothetical protein VHA56_16185 [Mucilaginibacter sp.]|nr:hypothetical protein [Mucilaginibacter sp.]